MNMLACTTHAIWWDESANLECPACKAEEDKKSRKQAINPSIDTEHHLDQMLTSDKRLYGQIMDTIGFAYNFGQIVLRAMEYEVESEAHERTKRELAEARGRIGELEQELMRVMDIVGEVDVNLIKAVLKNKTEEVVK